MEGRRKPTPLRLLPQPSQVPSRGPSPTCSTPRTQPAALGRGMPGMGLMEAVGAGGQHGAGPHRELASSPPGLGQRSPAALGGTML